MSALALAALLASVGTTGAQDPSPSWVDATLRSLDDGVEPLDLTVSVHGLLHGDWTVRLMGNTVNGSPGSNGTVTLSFADGVADPVSAQQPMTVPVYIGPDVAFDAQFEMDPLPLGATHLLLTLEGNASMSPFYWAQFQVDLDAPVGAAPTVLLRQVFPSSYTYVEPEWESTVTPELTGDDAGPEAPLNDLLGELPTDSDGSGGGAGMMAVAATTTLSGTIRIYQPGSSSVSLPCRLCFLEIWDDDCCGNADDKLGTVLADYNGFFTFSGLDNNDVYLGQDIFVKVFLDYASAPSKVVTGAGAVHSYTSPTLKEDCPNSSCSLGTKYLSPADEFRRAFFSWETVARGWNLMRNGGPAVDIGKVTVRFPTDVGYTGHTHSGTGAHYHTDSTKEIHLFSVHGNNDGPIAHEHGHYVMHKAYDFAGTYPSCGGLSHNIPTETTQTCAWTEGWGYYFALDARGTSSHTITGGTTYNHECNPASSCSTWGTGDDTEGRVTSTLWDIVDNTPAEGTGTTADTVDRSITQVWGALRYSRTSGSQDQKFIEYYGSWTAFGQSGAEFRNAASRNTITYT